MMKNHDAIIAQALQILAGRLRQPGAALTSPTAVVDYLRLTIGELEHEVFMALWLNTKYELLASVELFRGTIDSAAVYPREVVKEALAVNAAAVIFAHNHPSQTATPSQADRVITERLRRALELVQIQVLDHIVVGGMTTISFAEKGWL